jgi:hypothetical protein
MPTKAKGIAKDVRNTLPIPSKKDREKNMLTSPHTRLKAPAFPDRSLIFFPPKKLIYALQCIWANSKLNYIIFDINILSLSLKRHLINTKLIKKLSIELYPDFSAFKFPLHFL